MRPHYGVSVPAGLMTGDINQGIEARAAEAGVFYPRKAIQMDDLATLIRSVAAGR